MASIARVDIEGLHIGYTDAARLLHRVRTPVVRGWRSNASIPARVTDHAIEGTVPSGPRRHGLPPIRGVIVLTVKLFGETLKAPRAP